MKPLPDSIGWWYYIAGYAWKPGSNRVEIYEILPDDPGPAGFGKCRLGSVEKVFRKHLEWRGPFNSREEAMDHSREVAAPECDHIIGEWQGIVEGGIWRLSDARNHPRDLDFITKRFSFCPDCGKDIRHLELTVAA